uniref:Thyroid hormone receptor interactor 11 n=1 Tax=Macrostomum lignano TaxID=282301 RepID=A0A1I8IIN7_9PLAT
SLHPLFQPAVSNGNAEADLDAAKIVDYQDRLDKSSAELLLSRRQNSELSGRVRELEEALHRAQAESSRSGEVIERLQRDLKEAEAQREDQEERIATLEQRYLSAQRETTSAHERNDRLEEQLAMQANSLRLAEEKLRQLTASDSQNQQQQQQGSGSADASDKALAGSETGQADPAELLAELEEIRNELSRSQQREKLHEEHNSRLSATVDKLLMESNERLQLHLHEKMSALEERNQLSAELDRIRRALEDSQFERDDLTLELERLRQQQQQQLLQEGQACLRPARGRSSGVDGNGGGCGTPGSGGASAGRGEMSIEAKVRTLGEGDFERLAQQHVLQNVQQAFDSSAASSSDAPDYPSAFSDSADPQQTADAHSLAAMIQEQLDAINNEIRLIQEEKESTEQRAEELESRVGSASHLAASSAGWAGPSPPMSGRSTPATAAVAGRYMVSSGVSSGIGVGASPAYATVSSGSLYCSRHNHSFSASTPHLANTPVSVYHGQIRSASTLPHASAQLPMTTASSQSPQQQQQTRSDNSPPGTPRSLRLERVAQALAKAHDGFTGQSYEEPTPVVAQATRAPIARQHSLNIKQRIRNSLESPQSSPSSGSLMQMDATYPLEMAASYPGSPAASQQQFFGQKGEDRRRRKNKQHPRLLVNLPRREELLDVVMRECTSFAQWTGPTIVAWLELWVGMPAWYVAACRANVKSGAIMSNLSDQEIQREIGISNPLHRLKLRLAIQEMVTLTSPQTQNGQAVTQPNLNLACGQMGHEWIGNYWLPSLGLGQYRSAFMECLVDARMLPHLNKKDLRSHLKMVDAFHRASLSCGIQALHMLGFDRALLEARREECTASDTVWSSDRVQSWLGRIGLKEFAANLQDAGIHGALMLLDDSAAQARQTLEREMTSLVERERRLLFDTGDSASADSGAGVKLQRSNSWRKKLRASSASRKLMMNTPPPTDSCAASLLASLHFVLEQSAEFLRVALGIVRAHGYATGAWLGRRGEADPAQPLTGGLRRRLQRRPGLAADNGNGSSLGRDEAEVDSAIAGCQLTAGWAAQRAALRPGGELQRVARAGAAASQPGAGIGAPLRGWQAEYHQLVVAGGWQPHAEGGGAVILPNLLQHAVGAAGAALRARGGQADQRVLVRGAREAELGSLLRAAKVPRRLMKRLGSVCAAAADQQKLLHQNVQAVCRRQRPHQQVSGSHPNDAGCAIRQPASGLLRLLAFGSATGQLESDILSLAVGHLYDWQRHVRAFARRDRRQIEAAHGGPVGIGRAVAGGLALGEGRRGLIDFRSGDEAQAASQARRDANSDDQRRGQRRQLRVLVSCAWPAGAPLNGRFRMRPQLQAVFKKGVFHLRQVIEACDCQRLLQQLPAGSVGKVGEHELGRPGQEVEFIQLPVASLLLLPPRTEPWTSRQSRPKARHRSRSATAIAARPSTAAESSASADCGSRCTGQASGVARQSQTKARRSRSIESVTLGWPTSCQTSSRRSDGFVRPSASLCA